MNNPARISKLAAPDFVKVLRGLVTDHAISKLTGEDSSGLEQIIRNLKEVAKRRGIVWDLEESGKLEEYLDDRGNESVE